MPDANGNPFWFEHPSNLMSAPQKDGRPILIPREHQVNDPPLECVNCVPNPTKPESMIRGRERYFDRASEGGDTMQPIPDWHLHERHFDKTKYRTTSESKPRWMGLGH